MSRSARFSRFALRTVLVAAAVFSFESPVQSQTAAPHNLIVVYRDGSIPGNAEAMTRVAGARMRRRYERLGAAIVSATPAAEEQLRADPSVEYVVQDRPVAASSLLPRALPLEESPKQVHTATPVHSNVPTLHLPADTADTYYTNSPQRWAVHAVGGYGGAVADSETAGPWATSTGLGVRIAVLDSGVDRFHPDIAPNLALNLSEVDQAVQPSSCDDGSPQDQSGHGTWVASLAAGAAGNGTGRVVGVAPFATLLNIKVLQRMPGSGSNLAEQCHNGQAAGLMSWVLQGIDDAIAQHADIIILSVNTTLDLYSGDSAGLKASFDRVTHAAANAGAVLVAAVGNDALDLSNPRYVEIPAQSRDVLPVIASTNTACAEALPQGSTCKPGPVTMPYYSSYGTGLNAVAAPGGSYPLGTDDGVSGWVRGACSNGLPGTADGAPVDANHSEGCFNLGHTQYVQAIGTSASAPLVAGVVALVRAAHPDWSASTVLAAVRASAVPTPTMSYGVANAAAALAYNP